MKKYTAIALLITLISSSAFSTVLHWPECATGELSIQNKTQKPQKLWLQKFDPTLKTEVVIDLASSENFKMNLQKKNITERYTILHFENAKDIDVIYQCTGKKFFATTIEGGIQTFRKSDLAQQSLYLKNIYTNKNNFKIELLNKFREPIRTLNKTLSANEQRKLILLPTAELFYVRVSAENKFAAFNLNSQGSQNPMIVDTQKTLTDTTPGAVYFEIGPRTGFGDSFTVKITNPAMIDKARLQITNPNLEKMLFAKIQKGHNNQNRNLASVTKSFWNWSVTEVTNIADIGSTACNGLPQIVDDRIDSWTTDPGRICFWTYRIKREIPAAEIATGQKIN